MKFTNKLNLPESIVKSCTGDNHKPVEHRYSVTDLLNPINQTKLIRKHYDEIEVDVKDFSNVLFGSAVHKILEENTDEPDVETEVKMEINIFDCVLVGKFDRRNLKEKLIEDYKTATCTKVTRNDFEDFRLQGLMYSWMTYKKTGVLTRKLKFYVLLKDWSKIKASLGGNYPASPIYVWEYEVQDSDYDFISEYIKNKLTELESSDDSYCSDEERWFTGNKYAVYKKAGDARAAYISDSEEDAHNYITNKCNGAGEIQVRKGEYLRCKLYCDCNKFCKQWRKEENNGII